MTVPAARRMDTERRREHLLDVADEYLRNHGPESSLDEIAREAGVSPPLMRHYFRNRDGLVAALGERAAGQLEAIFLDPGVGDLRASAFEQNPTHPDVRRHVHRIVPKRQLKRKT